MANIGARLLNWDAAAAKLTDKEGRGASPDDGASTGCECSSLEKTPTEADRPLQTGLGNVRVAVVSGKGRCLFASRAFMPGDIILIEAPTLVAIEGRHPALFRCISAVNEEEALELPPVWHFAAIYSLIFLPSEKRKLVSNKWIPDPFPVASADVRRILASLPADFQVDDVEYERLLNAWRYNSFGHHTENDGLVMYDKISMMAHSCNPTGCWHYGANDEFVLRARTRLAPGDEISISYIGEEDLVKPTHIRREKLSSWLFRCECDRCTCPVDDCRGFRCPGCGVGRVFFKSDCEGAEESRTPCTACGVLLSRERMREFVAFEDAYIERLAETTSECMSDAEAVFREAQRVFAQHWVLHSLHSVLWEGYREAGDVEAATLSQRARLSFLSEAMPRVTYAHAWMAEEFADFVATSAGAPLAADADPAAVRKLSGFQRNTLARLYEDAMNELIILCGDTHEHTYAAHRKLELVGGAEETA